MEGRTRKINKTDVMSYNYMHMHIYTYICTIYVCTTGIALDFSSH